MFKMFNKGVKLMTAVALSLALTLTAMPSAFALNYKSPDGTPTANKPFSFSGYQYVDRTHIRVHFDKLLVDTAPVEYDKSLFTVKQHGTTTAIPVSSISLTQGNTTGDSGCSDTYLQKGAKVTLTLGSSLAYDTLYDVTVNNTLGANMTLGNYTYRKNITFTFRTPKSDGTYSSTVAPYVTMLVGDQSSNSNISYESNLVVVYDRPLDTASRTTFLTNLGNNYKRAGTKVSQDTTDAGTTGTFECYKPTSNNVNNVNTTFYFPMTKYQNTNCYNRKNPGSYSYTLTLPSFKDKSGKTWTTFYNSRTNAAITGFSFSTVSADLPGWERNGTGGANGPITVAATSTAGQLKVSWKATDVTPKPTGYYIYVTTSSNKWTGTYTYKASTTSNSYTLTGLSNANSYFVRVVPYNSVGTVGYSFSNATAVKPK